MDEPSLFHFFEYFSKYKLVNYIHLDPYLYEHLKSFTQSLRFLCYYASLRNAELVRKEEALYLRFFICDFMLCIFKDYHSETG